MLSVLSHAVLSAPMIHSTAARDCHEWCKKGPQYRLLHEWSMFAPGSNVNYTVIRTNNRGLDEVMKTQGDI